MINILSKFFKTNESELILELHKILVDESLLFSIPFSFAITYDLKIACFKFVIIYSFLCIFFFKLLIIYFKFECKMSYLVKKYPSNKHSNEFKALILNQDLIEDIDSYENYSNDLFYNDICNILRKDKSLNERPLLKTVYFLKLEKYKISNENF